MPAQPRSEGNVQHILALAQQSLQGIFDPARVGLGSSHYGLGVAQGGIEFLRGQFPLVRIGEVFFSVNGKAQRG